MNQQPIKFYVSFQNSKEFIKWNRTYSFTCLPQYVEQRIRMFKNIYNTKLLNGLDFAFIGTALNTSIENEEEAYLTSYQALMNLDEFKPIKFVNSKNDWEI